LVSNNNSLLGIFRNHLVKMAIKRRKNWNGLEESVDIVEIKFFRSVHIHLLSQSVDILKNNVIGLFGGNNGNFSLC
jgi:hypothetical protein